MIGIILTSHGKMAEGMLDSAKLFYGNDLKQIEAVSLTSDQSADDFADTLQQSISHVDSGDGVIVLADLFGGTPCNKAISCIQNHIHLISGMNLSLLLEILGTRENAQAFDLESVLQAAKDNMMHVNELFSNIHHEIENI